MIGGATARINTVGPTKKESDISVDDIYQDLRGRGLVHSLRRFSRDYLGRAENYAADRGLDRCAPAALVHLHRRLGAERQADLQARVLERLLQYGAASSAPVLARGPSSASMVGEQA